MGVGAKIFCGDGGESIEPVDHKALVVFDGVGEAENSLRAQLQALHNQIICILTSGFERAFSKSSKFDLRRLLGRS